MMPFIAKRHCKALSAPLVQIQQIKKKKKVRRGKGYGIQAKKKNWAEKGNTIQQGGKCVKGKICKC